MVCVAVINKKCFSFYLACFLHYTLKNGFVLLDKTEKKGKVLDCVCGSNHSGIRTRQFRFTSLIHNHYEDAKYPHDIASTESANPTLFIADK